MKRHLLLTAAIAAGAIGLQAATRYVDSQGTGDGSSWENASGDLQATIDASEAGDEIWVKAGTYKPTLKIVSTKPRSLSFKLKSGVSLYGGFAGTETAKEERKLKADGKKWEWANPTILSADDDVADKWIRELDYGSSSRYSWTVTGNENNFYHCVVANEELTERTVVDGFTMKGGNADYHKPYAGGAAVYAIGWIELSNCIFTENHAKFKSEGTKNFHGGAVTIISTAGTEGKSKVENCLFLNNKSSASYTVSYGGGLYIQKGSVSNCEFVGCVSLDGGGGLYNDHGTVTNCNFDDCYGGSGGGLYNDNGTASQITSTNCRALLGGGVYNDGTLSYARIANCYADSEDFSDMGGRGGGILNRSGMSLGSVATNCSAYNGGGIFVETGKIVNCTVQRNAVRNTAGTANIQIKEGLSETATVFNTIGNPDADASNFTKPSSFNGWSTDPAKSQEAVEADWSLTDGSAFIDAGKTTEGVSELTDIAGNPRIAGATIDVGAYEKEAPAAPNIIITFETNDPVKFGTGGLDGSTFSVDWGDGVLKEYSGAVYVTGIPTDKTVKIYGDELLILRATNCGITSVDISNAPKVYQVQIGYNKLTALDLSNNAALTGLYCESNAIESLDVSNLSLLRVLDCSDNKIAGTLDCSAMTSLTKLTCFNNRLTSISLPATDALLDIDCGMNQLTDIDVTLLPNLDILNINDNLLTSIDLSKNTKLTDLYCPANRLKALNLQANTMLTNISASENEIETVDISKNAELTGLYLQNNQLTELDITGNPKISWMNLENNRLTTIDASSLSQLRLLNVAGNRLTALDVTASPLVSTLHTGNNMLTSLDVSKQTSLSWLTCSNNQLKALDLSKNSYLSWLECADNQIERLEVGHMSYLQKVIAGNNRLTALDLSKNAGIQGVMIEKNLMDATAINTLIDALPDVSSVEIHENNAEWAKQLNISEMPGTQDARKSDAEAKGWIVTATGDGAVESMEAASSAVRYDASSATLTATAEMSEITVYTSEGKLVARFVSTTTADLNHLPAGVYVAKATDTANSIHSVKFMR